ncbi:DUF2213 domain-containing protein [Herbaspirillum robiniae]|uniref:DUF2213 domain-containing protein n=1 Tax=Herbaspirillum robiniae TaxID=2014887 RepID=UPI001EDB6824|nr:DUF2213 domain-containing protein [Herbaspirillum robiniae]
MSQQQQKRRPTTDRAPEARVLTQDRMRFYSTFKLGPKRSLTPEGFLLCEDVPVARTGEMLYMSTEVPVAAGPDGIVRISRDADELFSEITLASAVGKPTTLDHPEEFVGPANYRQLSMGQMLNPRQGDGIENDLMLADLLIMDQKGIDAIQVDGIEEVSLGYDANYEEVSPGRGVQRNIVVNHVALVPRGRCGPRCAIGDKEPGKMSTKTKTPAKRSWMDRLRTAMKAKDEAAVQEAIEEGQEAMDADPEDEEEEGKGKPDKTADALVQVLKAVKSLDKRMAKMEARDAESEKETKDEDEEDDKDKKKTGDDGDLTEAETAGKLNQSEVDLYTGDSAATILSRAEILVPGIKVPTVDAKASTKDRAVALCSCQRKALDTAFKTDAGKSAITPFLGGQAADFEKMPVHQVHATFMGASELMKARNNDGTSASKINTRDFGKRHSVADMNAANRKFWNRDGSAN